ncbi:MAG TPA: Type 1 glutamine amidotransferase-like domain-containing protein [Thermoanaerobaculia bacterium]|nr:Type 1 glutamine amidotransferase-like domain-containing protein [Thermoanaerobaculia bacterium]
MKPLDLNLATPVQLLVLIGGGEFSFGETRAIDEMLIARMPKDRRTIAFLPTASGSAEYATHIGNYFRSIDPTVNTINVPIYRGRDSRRQRNLDQILSAGMIYLGGGVTNNLLATIRESPADLALRDAAANGAVVAAIGAAASSFGTYARDMARSGGALPALGWLEATAVDTAFRPEDDVPLRRLMSIPEIELGLGIPAGAALAVSGGGRTEIVGSGSVAVFRKPAS